MASSDTMLNAEPTVRIRVWRRESASGGARSLCWGGLTSCHGPEMEMGVRLKWQQEAHKGNVSKQDPKYFSH